MYYFIVNPVSRSGEGMRNWKQLETILKERNIEYEVYFTKYPGHGTKLAKKCSRLSNSRIIAMGGDGTVDEVINGLPMNGSTTFGYIPVGSGNDFARGMKLPFEPVAALERILALEEGAPMDAGVVQTAKRQAYFGISSGFGYDAEVCYDVSHSSAKKILNFLHLGKLVYAFTAVKLLFTFRPSDVDVVVDDQEPMHFKKTYLISAMNLQYQGGGFQFCPDALQDDGELDFMIAHSFPKIVLLILFPIAYWGKHTKIPGIVILRGKKMKINSNCPQKIHQDGEYVGITQQLTYTTKKHAFKFL